MTVKHWPRYCTHSSSSTSYTLAMAVGFSFCFACSLKSIGTPWRQHHKDLAGPGVTVILQFCSKFEETIITIERKCEVHWCSFKQARTSRRKPDTILLSISLLNIDRFSQFFHRRILRCYTTLWNVKNRKTSNNLNQVSCLTINQQIFNELHEPYPR